MVVGKGLIANAFSAYKDNDDILIFASGVSNSSDFNEKNFQREKELLLSFSDTSKRLIYFSTTGIYDPHRKTIPYIKHKLEVEKIIQENFQSWSIFRLPNIIGDGGNPATMINFFCHAIRHDEPLTIKKHTTRYFLSIDDVSHILGSAISQNKFINATINVCPPLPHSIESVVKTIESVLEKSANITTLNEGVSYQVPNRDFLEYMASLDIEMKADYLDSILTKYCAN